MVAKEYRRRMAHRPPHYYDEEQNRIMFARSSRKHKEKWDEELVVARILADMRIVGRWLNTLMPNLYLESGLYSGVMVSMSVPSEELIPGMSFLGDVDILVIPYCGDDLILSKTVVVEIKVIRGEKRRPGKSPNRFGYSQAQALIDEGFPYVAVGHVVVTDDSSEKPNRDMLAANVGENETISSHAPVAVDMFENDFALRALGRLSKNCPNDQIGYFAMNYDGRRLFEPLGRSCGYNRNCTKRLLDRIMYFYEKNYRVFCEVPRYSNTDIELWESRLQENPETPTPWDVSRNLLQGERVLTSAPYVVRIDGVTRIGALYSTADKSYLFYK